MYLSYHLRVARRAKFRPMVLELELELIQTQMTLQIAVPLHLILSHSTLQGINHAPKVRKTLIKIWRDSIPETNVVRILI
jgi:hypothetical protein